MGTIERTGDHRVLIGSALLAIVLLVVIARYWTATPQMGADEDVFKTVDALFTAMNRKDRQGLDDCEQRFRDYRESGALPVAAANRLESIITKARAGGWDSAAHRLYDFMLAQRRTP